MRRCSLSPTFRVSPTTSGRWCSISSRSAHDLPAVHGRSSARVPALAGRDFTWPEFDRWQAFFAARRRFPVRWDGLQVTPPARTPAAEAYQRRKLDLLFEWLDALTRRSMILAHYARQGLETRIVAQNTGEACAGCVPFVARGSDQTKMPCRHSIPAVGVSSSPCTRPALGGAREWHARTLTRHESGWILTGRTERRPPARRRRKDEALMSMEQVAQMRPMLVPAALAV